MVAALRVCSEQLNSVPRGSLFSLFLPFVLLAWEGVSEMVSEKEKILLDYMYVQAQNLLDFMRRNGYEGYQHTMITALIDKDDDKYNSICVDATQMEQCESVRRVSREYDIVNERSTYKEWVRGEENGRQN